MNKKCKKRKNTNIFETAGNMAKSLKFQSWALHLGALLGIIFTLKLYIKNIFCTKLNNTFKVVKTDLGSKFMAWVSFHTAILQSRKCQDNLGRTVIVLPLYEETPKV